MMHGVWYMVHGVLMHDVWCTVYGKCRVVYMSHVRMMHGACRNNIIVVFGTNM